jgi:hypothetical protein
MTGRLTAAGYCAWGCFRYFENRAGPGAAAAAFKAIFTMAPARFPALD